MADVKISELAAATTPDGTESVPVVQGGATKKATVDQVLAPHTGDGSAAHAASAVSVTPTGGIAATDVQGALAELDSEKSGTGHNHSGTYDPAGTAASAVAAHEADGDPHAGYLTEVAASGAYQPLDGDLTSIAGLETATAGTIATDGAGWVRKTYAQLKTALGLVKGDVGLGNVDNTSDTAKPVSTAQQTALDLKAPIASPALTGNPTAPTPTAGDSDTSIATTAFATGAVADHAAAADPHTGYQKESEKGAANGYAGLGATGLVPPAQLGTGTASSSTFLRGDGTYASPAGGGGGDLLAANNLSDVANAATALSNLGGQPVDSDLTAIAALTTTAFGRALLALADAAALRSSAGLVLGTDIYSKAAVDAGFQPLDSDLTALAALSTTAFGRSVMEAANAEALRTLAGVVIGTDVQAYDAELAAIASLTSAANKLPYFTGSGAAALADLTAFARTLLDDADAATARATLAAPATSKTINDQTGTTYTLVLGDAGLDKWLRLNNAGAITLTVPPNSSVAFPVGAYVEGNQAGAGQVTVTPGSGVTVNGTPGLKVAAQYGTFGLLKVATDTWLAFGRLSA